MSDLDDQLSPMQRRKLQGQLVRLQGKARVMQSIAYDDNSTITELSVQVIKAREQLDRIQKHLTECGVEASRRARGER